MILKGISYAFLYFALLWLYVQARATSSSLMQINHDLDEVLKQHKNIGGPSLTENEREFNAEREKVHYARDLKLNCKANGEENQALYNEKLAAKEGFEVYLKTRRQLDDKINELISKADQKGLNELVKCLMRVHNDSNDGKRIKIETFSNEIVSNSNHCPPDLSKDTNTSKESHDSIQHSNSADNGTNLRFHIDKVFIINLEKPLQQTILDLENRESREVIYVGDTDYNEYDYYDGFW
ncbi:uncharacterized protein LOC128858407 [Anastrepha ludens]|uniref:uncharacterized protein LOC128858407 n=1 Tax=Anastrepha ludens TaxID=28586 RepID=UPI0023B06C6A|nr:uncharacterized protein LOC128858407 [Anastrepha ludens]